MSLIQYKQASYANQVRSELELVGCETAVAAVVSRAVGELIDHVTQAEENVRREIKDREFQASMRGNELTVYKRDLFDRFIGLTLLVMAIAIVSGVLGVLIALFR